jgi:hypothetical protein
MSDLPIDLEKVRAFLGRKRERTRRARAALLEQAQGDARAIIERIARDHNPSGSTSGVRSSTQGTSRSFPTSTSRWKGFEAPKNISRSSEK